MMFAPSLFRCLEIAFFVFLGSALWPACRTSSRRSKTW